MKAPPEAPPPLPAALAALTGQGVAAIDTPAAVIDLDAMERNLARMAAFARTHGVRLRPHAKMHKSAFLARLQMQAGAVGVCVQKTSEAEALAAAGVTDIYISNEVSDAAKLQRVAALAQRLQAAVGRLAIAVDSLEGIARLAAAFEALAAGTMPPLVDVFVEIDVGQGRCARAARRGRAVALAQAIAAQPVLRFAGLQAYHGRAQHQRGVAERRDAIARARPKRCKTPARGSRPQALRCRCCHGRRHRHLCPGDGQRRLGRIAGRQLPVHGRRLRRQRARPGAARLRARAVHQEPGHLRQRRPCRVRRRPQEPRHRLGPATGAWPARPAAADLRANGGDEHGILHPPDGSALPGLGDTVWLIPGHCDPTVNLHDHLIGVRGGLEHGTVERIIRVDARGALT
jgi:D-serine deaminase-like pyridoxal phosphate-dependent protein